VAVEIPPFDRRTMLGLLIAALIPAFAFTHTVVSRYRVSRQQLAAEWSARGDRDVDPAPGNAVGAFETALSYGPERTGDRLRLGEALIQARQPAEARAQLLTLWTDQPGNGRINLDLARLEAADGNVRKAVRYYHGAVDGSWQEGAANARRQARLEAARLLLAHGERFPAQSELIALIDDLPPDSNAITEVAGLLVDAGAEARARTMLDRALALDHGNVQAARLAGIIAFRRGDYAAARAYLRSAGTLDAQSSEMLAVSDEVLVLDPYARRITSTERATRANRALDVARDRLNRCSADASALPAAVDPYENLRSRLTSARKTPERRLAHDSEALDAVMSLAFEIEHIPENACGPLDARDRALLALSARRNGGAQ
jgi:tetratricopeptide (TPR) repeat protein